MRLGSHSMQSETDDVVGMARPAKRRARYAAQRCLCGFAVQVQQRVVNVRCAHRHHPRHLLARVASDKARIIRMTAQLSTLQTPGKRQIGGSRSCLTQAAKRRRSAGHVEYGISSQIAAIEDGDRVLRRKNYKLDFPKLCVLFHFGHHRQPALCSGAYNQPAAAPRNVFLDRDGRVAVGIPIPLGSLFLPLSNLASVNDQIEVINSAVDLHRAERELLEVHRHHPQYEITPPT